MWAACLFVVAATGRDRAVLPEGVLIDGGFIVIDGALIGQAGVVNFGEEGQQPPDGFFLGGSSVTAMNGVYIKVPPERLDEVKTPRYSGGLPKGVSAAAVEDSASYVNHLTGWLLLHLVEGDEPAVGGGLTEWVILDEALTERFAHPEGRLPGEGRDWTQLHRRPRFSTESNAPINAPGTSAAADDDDTLPWMVQPVFQRWAMQHLVKQSKEYRGAKPYAPYGDPLAFRRKQEAEVEATGGAHDRRHDEL